MPNPRYSRREGDGLVDAYVGRISQVTPERQRELGERGDNKTHAEALELAGGNLGLAFSSALGFVGRGIDLSDLIQQAWMEGILPAAEKYDSSKGDFTAYGGRAADNQMRRVFRHFRMRGVPEELHQMRAMITHEVTGYESDGLEPDWNAIGEKFDISPVRANVLYHEYLNFAERYNRQSTKGREHVTEPEQDIYEGRFETIGAIREALSRLPLKHREVLRVVLFTDPRPSFPEAGLRLYEEGVIRRKCTRQNVIRLYKNALKKLSKDPGLLKLVAA